MYSIKDRNGNDVDKSRYKIDFEKKTFSTNQTDLIIDFSGLDGWTFYTGSYCEFETGDNCKFDTGIYCIFKTGNDCKFDTLYYCKFKTGDNCELKFYGKEYKSNKGFYFIDNNCKLHRDIDENWALLNTKHNNEFIRDVCKFILKGNYDV